LSVTREDTTFEPNVAVAVRVRDVRLPSFLRPAALRATLMLLVFFALMEKRALP
jgi:hypothetical protein